MSLNPRLRRPQINFNTRKLRTQYLNYRTNNSISRKRSKQSKQRKRVGRGIKNFTKRLSLKKYTKFRQFGGNNIECAICLDDDFTTNPYSWVKLPCNHDFHLKCIILWAVGPGDNPTCPKCRFRLDEVYEALQFRQLDLDTALQQNNVPPPIRLPLRLPVANQPEYVLPRSLPPRTLLVHPPITQQHQSQPIGQSSSFQRLPPRLNRETMSFHELRTRERRPLTFFIRPPVTQQHEPRRLDITNPSEWALLSSTTPITQQPQLRVLSRSNREDRVFLSRIPQINPNNFIRRYTGPPPRVTVNI